MIGMVPIPKRLLPSRAEVRAPEEEGGRQGFSDKRLLLGVRYEQRASVRATDYQLQDATTGLLFIDAVNTAGAMELPAGSLVSVDGATECCVASCTRYVDERGHVHHWEVELK